MIRRIKLIVAIIAWMMVLRLAAAAATGYEVYSVQPGDTLATVAQRFKLSPQALAEQNGLPPGATLRAGQSLTIAQGPTAGGEKDQGEFAAEERQAVNFAKTYLNLQPAADARSGPVVGYLGIATENTAAVDDPRIRRRVCAIKAQANLCVNSQYEGYYGILMRDGALAWIPKRSVALQQQVELVAAGIGIATNSAPRPPVIDAAFRYYGLPYRYGGTPPGPTDCSALVQAAFRDCGVALPRTAAAQFSVGTPVSGEELAVGDRLYFYNKDGRIGHTAIYIGGGQFIHASSRRGYVGVDSLLEGFYRSRYAGARR